jgi:hypothetical protein
MKALEQRNRLLGGVAQALPGEVMDRSNIGPDILQRHRRLFIYITLEHRHATGFGWPVKLTCSIELVELLGRNEPMTSFTRDIETTLGVPRFAATDTRSGQV